MQPCSTFGKVVSSDIQVVRLKTEETHTQMLRYTDAWMHPETT